MLCQIVDQLSEELSSDILLSSDVRSPSVDNFQFSLEQTVHCDRSLDTPAHLNFKNPRWRTAAILKTVKSPYLCNFLATEAVPAMKPEATAIGDPQHGRWKITLMFDGRRFCIPKFRYSTLQQTTLTRQ